MSYIYYPFDAGAGANITEAQWSTMAQLWMRTGIIPAAMDATYPTPFAVFADSSGMQVKVPAGKAWIKGHYFESTAQETIAIAAAHATNPRIDLVVVRLNWTTNAVSLAVVQGTPATTPVAPTVTQNTATWEVNLAQVRVNAAVSTITAGNVTDERSTFDNYARPHWTPPRLRAFHSVNQSVATGSTATYALLDSESYDTDNMHATGAGVNTAVVLTPGIYLCAAYLRWATNATGTRYLGLNRLNAADIPQDSYEDTRLASASQNTGLSVTIPMAFAVGEKCAILPYQDSGGALNITKVTLVMQWLSPLP